jgi:hypothetical protein
MRFKAVLLLFLVFFASVGTIALVNPSARSSVVSNGRKTATVALGVGSVQPAGGDPVDNPQAPN